jgi:hypothetical protein
MLRHFIAAGAALAALLSSGGAYAWDGQITGTIAVLDAAADGENYGFRVRLDGNPVMCGTADSWAAINKSANNYDAIVGLMTSALLGGKSVTVYSNADAAGHCIIGYIIVRK